MIRQFLPYRLEGLPWYDRLLTALRGLMLVVLVVGGGRIALDGQGADTGVVGTVLAAMSGGLLGLIAFVVTDTAAWTSGQRQEGYEQERDRGRARAAAAASPSAPSATPARPARPRRNGPADQDGRPAGAVGRRPSGDPRTAGAVVKAPARWRPSDELLAAVTAVVRKTGPSGATREGVGDMALTAGHDLTHEQLVRVLVELTEPGGPLTRVEPVDHRDETRWYAVEQVRVPDALLAGVTQVVTESGTDPVDVDGVRSGLLRLGVEPSAPALARALRVLVADGLLTTVFGGYVRSGL